jgi:serine protease Do
MGELTYTMTVGYVSAVDRFVNTDGTPISMIQVDAAINPGNSGGALLNREGKLIGVCFLKIVADGYEGMGFAISSDTVVKIIDELKENGKIIRPVLGITVNTLYNETEAKASGLPAGVWVEEVVKGSAAYNAGIESSSIITEFNGEEIKSYSDLKEELAKYKPGDEITLKVYCYNSVIGRGQYKNYKVILGEAE